MRMLARRIVEQRTRAVTIACPFALPLDLSAVDAAGELGLAARSQNARLFDPVLALDAALEVQHFADALDVARRPVGHLFVAGDPERVQLLLDEHADTANA